MVLFFKKGLLPFICLPAFARTDVISLGTAPLPPAGYTSLPYVNPNAPKGGSFTLGAVGDFDNLNPFILRGAGPDTIYQVWQPLFKLSDTDSVTEYAELARAVTVNKKNVTFTLDPRAKFSDGVPVTSEDVLWTYNTLITQGLPFYAAEYSEVANVSAPNSETVVFALKPGAGADTVFNLAGLYVLPEHFYAGTDFSTPEQKFPIGSGAYQVSSVTWGGAITYTHVKHWWAANIPSDVGFDNFDTITELFFRQKSVLVQAFKAGQIDAIVEDSASDWREEARSAALRALVPETLPAGMTGLVMNTREKIFADPRIRHAFALAFDFEWANRALYDGFYTRTTSYFSNSPMAATGTPSPSEAALLAPYKSQLPATVYQPFTLPVTDGSGYNLPELEAAMKLFAAAGWRVKNFALTDASGTPIQFEILLDDPKYLKIIIPYIHDLGLLGITATARLVDPATYLRREQNFAFDMTPATFPVSADPGSEQAAYWGCAAAHTPGSANLAGACSPAIDAMIAAELAAPNAGAKITAIHALDRLLLNSWYVVPLFHANQERLAWWPSKVAKPDAPLQVGHDFTLWWAK